MDFRDRNVFGHFGIFYKRDLKCFRGRWAVPSTLLAPPLFRNIMNYGNFNVKFHSGQPSVIYKDFNCDLVKNNPQITTEEIAKRLYIDKSTSFLYLKNLEHTLKLYASEMGDELLESPNIYRKRFKEIISTSFLLSRRKSSLFLHGKSCRSNLR